MEEAQGKLIILLIRYPWKFGDSLNLSSAMRRCENDHSEGCEQWYMIN